MSNIPEGQMCEMGCGRKALFVCGTSMMFAKDGTAIRHLYTCLECGSDVRWSSPAKGKEDQ